MPELLFALPGLTQLNGAAVEEAHRALARQWAAERDRNTEEVEQWGVPAVAVVLVPEWLLFRRLCRTGARWPRALESHRCPPILWRHRVWPAWR
jgi:hypothetical protein